MSRQTGTVLAVNISDKKGVPKTPIQEGMFLEEHGLQGDAHAGKWHRQVSLLGIESMRKLEKATGKGLCLGVFAENLTTEGLILYDIPVGTKLKIGETIQQVTQIGKECHDECPIKRNVGQCALPKEGIFTRVLQGGKIRPGDRIIIMDEISQEGKKTMFKAGILIASDKGSRGERVDESGKVIEEIVKKFGMQVTKFLILPDELDQLSNAMVQMSDELGIDLILTSGGTGFAPRDITPEATLKVIDRLAPGICEAIRYHSLSITPRAMLSRAISGIRKKTLIVNLPGSPKAVREALDFIIEPLIHGLEIMTGHASECARK